MNGSIFLVGFRATGKSTIAKILAKKLGWTVMDMDKEIEGRAAQSIKTLTKDGTEWKSFRMLETQVLNELAQKQNLVVSCGGGVGVNDIDISNPNIIDKHLSGSSNVDLQTFGQLQAKILKNNPKNIIILLTASEQIISSRLRSLEIKNQNSHRPDLDGNTTKDLDEMISNNITKFRERQELYLELTDKIVDTGENNQKQILSKIYTFIGLE